nr:putative ribonuclease H-like domain-containing protein [Tanacetum cinerariifolium]
MKRICDFLHIKGIKREFSVARAPQQNEVAETENRTLIEVVRTMLADSLLHIPFWVEAVNIACYVQNKVLVTKPHNKTPYELLLGRSPSIGFMRPFRCPVTVLNTLDPIESKVGKEIISSQQYALLPLWAISSQDPQNTDDDVADAAFDVKENANDVYVSANGKSSFNSTNKVNAINAPVNAVGPNPTNNTNSFNTTSPSINVVSLNFGIARKYSFVDPFTYLDDPDIPKLEDIVYLYDEEDVGTEADLSNLETNIPVSPIPTTRFHKDHHVNQIIGDLNLAPQTRSMTRMVKEQGGLHQINNEDFHTCMFACFLSQEEPKKVHQAIKDSSWNEDMQEELLQFKLQKRHTQEEGMDCDEVFAPVAKIEAIRLFLAYASFMGFMVYQMDVKSAFLYGTIKEELTVAAVKLMCLSANRTAWNEFSCSMAFVVTCLATAEEQEEVVEVPIAPSPLAPQDPTPIPHATPPQDQPSTSYDSPPQDQPTTPHESSIPLLTTLMETYATLSQKVAELEQDKHSQAMEILQLNKIVKRLEKKKRSKSLGFKRLRKLGTTQSIESSSGTVLGAQEDASKQGEDISH